jgi:hypothetical protein
MPRFIRSCRAGLTRLLGLRIRLPLPAAHQVVACLSVLGLLALSFMAGAAVMHFRLPSSGFFDKAFTGAKAWHERGRPDDPAFGGPGDPAREGVLLDTPGKAFDGFTLYTTTAGPRARLVDMRGKLLHQWELPFRKAWPRPPHVRDPLPDEQVHWFRCHLYPNGDLLALYHAAGDTPYGYGLVKLDRHSNLLWAYAGNAHHDLDVAEDGTIYTLAHRIVREPPRGLEFLPGPLIVDSLVVLSPGGRELDSVPILEAFRDSPYALLLFAPPSGPAALPPRESGAVPKGDLVHANSVRVLRRALAPKFPLFKPGQVLISLRERSLLAVLDTRTRSVVWAARGPWKAQHDAEFLPDGRILLYDNVGSDHASRVLEYDPRTQAIPWAYSCENTIPFRAQSRGTKQRLPNGNTLVVDPDDWLLLEVTRGKDVVWKYCCGGIVTGAWRYGPDELTFLKGGARARP